MAKQSMRFELSVFLVEPSPVQAQIVRGYLQHLGIVDVQNYPDAGQALTAMRRNCPEIVISSLYLPDMTGTEFVAAMRQEKALQKAAFVLISSETRPQALDPVRQSGVCAIVPKPFTENQLERAIEATQDFLGRDDGPPPSDDFSGLKVLIVDDSASSRQFIRFVFENLGVSEILESVNGVEAAKLLKDTAVDLVITDYNMPEMDGRALVEHIRTSSWQNAVPILMVTSESDKRRLAVVQDAGVSGIFDKPFEPGMMRRLLAKIMAGRTRGTPPPRR